jgi:hypothetical protein
MCAAVPLVCSAALRGVRRALRHGAGSRGELLRRAGHGVHDAGHLPFELSRESLTIGLPIDSPLRFDGHLASLLFLRKASAFSLEACALVRCRLASRHDC